MLTNPELEKQPSKEPSLIPGGAPVDPLVRTDTPRINASSAADVTSDKLEDNQDSKNENDSENKQEFKSDEGTLS